MVDLNFALLREGTSDEGLIPHLASLLVRAGATSAAGTVRTYKGSTKSKLAKVAAEAPIPDLIFVHRDADSPSSAQRREEVKVAATATGLLERCIAVVPVQELEAWLLLDEASIRQVAGRPSGKVPLGLPNASAIEQTKSPKELLASALLLASEAHGRKMQKHRAAFSQRAERSSNVWISMERL